MKYTTGRLFFNFFGVGIATGHGDYRPPRGEDANTILKGCGPYSVYLMTKITKVLTCDGAGTHSTSSTNYIYVLCACGATHRKGVWVTGELTWRKGKRHHSTISTGACWTAVQLLCSALIHHPVANSQLLFRDMWFLNSNPCRTLVHKNFRTALLGSSKNEKLIQPVPLLPHVIKKKPGVISCQKMQHIDGKTNRQQKDDTATNYRKHIWWVHQHTVVMQPIGHNRPINHSLGHT